ncbi:MAG: Crp/Fnr family transcriptional regulator [Bacteroidota bacterium]
MITDKLFQSIKQAVNDLDIDTEELSTFFQYKKVKKGDKILSAGQTCNRYFYVNNGAFRIYFIKNGDEFTHWFCFEGILFTELESYTFKQPTQFYIEALEECEILTILRPKMEELLSKYPDLQEFLRKNWELAFIKLSHVIASFQSKNAKERYNDLFEYSELLQRTSQKDISSMLGITQYSLSRIRKEKG